MGAEDNIVRSTIYCPKYLHDKAKEANINISHELTCYLETILFGDNVTDVNYQYEQLFQRKKNLELELVTINSRLTKLKKLIKEHDSKLIVEKNKFNKFMNHCRGILKNSVDGQIPVDENKICSYWEKDYFQGNGLDKKMVLTVFKLVENDKFDFETFKSIKRGESLGY